MKLKGRTINEGTAEGEAIVSKVAFSFLGDFDPQTGKTPVKGSDLGGRSLTNKIFVFPTGKGSTVGPYVAYKGKKNGTLPKAMICTAAEPVVVLGALIADIPMIDRLNMDPVEVIRTGDYVKVDATEGIVEVIKAR